MASFFIATLGISIVGMVLLLIIKRYELATNTVVFESLRPGLNRFFHLGVLFVERYVPAFTYAAFRRVTLLVMNSLHRLVAQCIVYAEYWLERVLDFLHLTTHAPHPTTPASAFLREVAEHKKNLLRSLPHAEVRRASVVVQK